ncbi:MAG: metallophosphoesterase [Hormoscilla sp.]
MLNRFKNGTLILASIILLLLSVLLINIGHQVLVLTPMQSSQLLTDPFLQLPAETSVRVVWFTEFPGVDHRVAYGEGFSRTAIASTVKLSRAREDQKSRVGNQTTEGQIYQNTTGRNIWRHEAEVAGLKRGTRIPYRVTSVRANGEVVRSRVFTLAPQPTPGMPVKILLTSDHQLKPMTPANLQKVVATVGRVDAVFFAGDLVNIPDRASEWFDDNRGNAFFPSLQGRANYSLEKNGVATTYTGGELIQHAPLFPAIGNHEVMGRFDSDSSLNDQYNDSYPRAAAAQIAQELNITVSKDWLQDNSFNTDSYEEIFTLPQNIPGREKYYAVTFGDIRLVVPYITNMWRPPSLGKHAKGRFRESDRDLQNPVNWGYGQHIFEPIKKGSTQYNWLKHELESPEFRQAKLKIVMFHHPPHSLGDNVVPAYTDPVQAIARDAAGNIQAVRYEYPKEADYIIRDVMPLLESSGVQLVLFGHSHLWNRFVSPSGMHFLETSNVGNSYGASFGDKQRSVPVGYREEYVATGDPNGLEPLVPTIAPLRGEDGQLLPYIASNDITVFSILDTGKRVVSSYYFDTRQPDSDVVKFDEFRLAANGER